MIWIGFWLDKKKKFLNVFPLVPFNALPQAWRIGSSHLKCAVKGLLWKILQAPLENTSFPVNLAKFLKTASL